MKKSFAISLIVLSCLGTNFACGTAAVSVPGEPISYSWDANSQMIPTHDPSGTLFPDSIGIMESRTGISFSEASAMVRYNTTAGIPVQAEDLVMREAEGDYSLSDYFDGEIQSSSEIWGTELVARADVFRGFQRGIEAELRAPAGAIQIQRDPGTSELVIRVRVYLVKGWFVRQTVTYPASDREEGDRLARQFFATAPMPTRQATQ